MITSESLRWNFLNYYYTEKRTMIIKHNTAQDRRGPGYKAERWLMDQITEQASAWVFLHYF